jgi:hypothetical protein
MDFGLLKDLYLTLNIVFISTAESPMNSFFFTYKVGPWANGSQSGKIARVGATGEAHSSSTGQSVSVAGRETPNGSPVTGVEK